MNCLSAHAHLSKKVAAKVFPIRNLQLIFDKIEKLIAPIFNCILELVSFFYFILWLVIVRSPLFMGLCVYEFTKSFYTSFEWQIMVETLFVLSSRPF